MRGGGLFVLFWNQAIIGNSGESGPADYAFGAGAGADWIVPYPSGGNYFFGLVISHLT